MTYEQKPQPATLAAEMDRQGITVRSEFVPWSKSRDFEEGRPIWNRTLQWKVRVVISDPSRLGEAGDREILSTTYGAGIAHAPAYQASKLQLGDAHSIARTAALEFEIENGRKYLDFGRQGPKIEPKAPDVIWSLCSDAQAIDARDFENWASDLGFDPDSRKAEAIYRACLDTALKLRAALGDHGLSALREAAQDF